MSALAGDQESKDAVDLLFHGVGNLADHFGIPNPRSNA
jgi:hypothetical protein